MTLRLLCTTVLLLLSVPGSVWAQASDEDAGKSSRRSSVVEAAAKFLGTDGQGIPPFTVAFGGIKAGSGIALGPAVGHTFADRSFVQGTAEYSVRHYKLLQLRYQSRPLWKDRATISVRARWQDAPTVSMFQLGMDSSIGRAVYAERRSELSGQVNAAPTPVTRFAAGVGLERYRVGSGRLDLAEDEALQVVPPLPGLATNSRFVHLFVAGGIDTRPAPGYSRRGTVLQAALHDYRDATTHRYSFVRFVPEARTIIPVQEKAAVDLSGRAWLSAAGASQEVPFFLMPWLGGGDYLAGFPNYRFRDRNALQVTAEYRRAVHAFADVAGFVQSGVVAARVRDLDPGRMAPSVGVAVIAHSDKMTFLRAEVARSRERWRAIIGFSLQASAVF